jgi:hypothetical protein
MEVGCGVSCFVALGPLVNISKRPRINPAETPAGRARSLGAITFVMAESGRRYGNLDLAFFEDLASCAGLAAE